MHLKKIIYIFTFLFLVNSVSRAQDQPFIISVTDTFRINLNNIYELNSTNIIPFSDTVRLGDRLLKRGSYTINYRILRLSLSDSLLRSFKEIIIVSYRTLLTGLNKNYARRKLIVRSDPLSGDSIKVINIESEPITGESIFGKDIQRSGSLIRGFTVGSNKDFTVNSGLRLQLSGKLSDDIDIVSLSFS